jgi:hypothetical protein
MLTVLTLGSRCWGALCRRRTRLEEIGWGRPDHTSADSTEFERGELGVFANSLIELPACRSAPVVIFCVGSPITLPPPELGPLRVVTTGLPAGVSFMFSIVPSVTKVPSPEMTW